MSEIQQDIVKLESQIAAAKEVIEQANRMRRLTANSDFRALITEGFMKDECARYTHMSTDSSLKPEDRADALGYAQAAGYLKRFINVILRMGDNQAGALPEAEETLEELRVMAQREEAAASPVDGE